MRDQNPSRDAQADLIAPDYDRLTQTRRGERKLIEAVWRPDPESNWLDQIQQACAAGVRFVLMGVPEHVGVLANHGVAGAQDAWDCALPGIANVQSNRFLSGADLWIAGAMDPRLCRSANEESSGSECEIDSLRARVEALDQQLAALIEPVFAAGLHPVVIGGGNNNSLPILRALATTVRRQRSDATVHALNCDPHADFRAPEGRHSGNPFRYAIEEGTLDRYFALLLHRNYNSEPMLRAMSAANAGVARIGCNWLDDVLEGTFDIGAALEEAIEFVAGGDAIGLELDCDAIAGFPTSAYTPSGLSVDQARSVMLRAARRLQPRYLHLSEAAPSRTADGALFTRKALTYLVTDHLRAMGATGEASGG